ncbi:hypothetical protein L3X38_037332 [Prunus dulcis]|uniref:Uncharacterized protein n=1 Tax=Prunus dulcis TaxID=3755 RepID=A0AAD4V2W8_PRUDU|nr:hypothetical protein L3X38_037332 [Prunus dulcis]
MIAEIAQNGGKKPEQSRPNPSFQRLPERRLWLGFRPIMIAGFSRSHLERSQPRGWSDDKVTLPDSGGTFSSSLELEIEHVARLRTHFNKPKATV